MHSTRDQTNMHELQSLSPLRYRRTLIQRAGSDLSLCVLFESVWLMCLFQRDSRSICAHCQLHSPVLCGSDKNDKKKFAVSPARTLTKFCSSWTRRSVRRAPDEGAGQTVLRCALTVQDIDLVMEVIIVVFADARLTTRCQFKVRKPRVGR
jgi:hypothetical protein